jgi:hypothetical protein
VRLVSSLATIALFFSQTENGALRYYMTGASAAEDQKHASFLVCYQSSVFTHFKHKEKKT